MPIPMNSREADAWRALARRAVRIARRRNLGGVVVLLGLGAVGGTLGGVLLTARDGPPARRVPVPGPVRAVARTTVAELLLHRVGSVRGPAPRVSVTLRRVEAEWVGVFGPPSPSR